MPPPEPPPSEEPRAGDREPDARGDAPARKERLLKDDGRYIIFYDFAQGGDG